PSGAYGLIVRDQGPDLREGANQRGQYYALEVNNAGEYGIWRRDSDQWIETFPWTPSDFILRGAARNELTVRAVGEELIFTVNNQRLASVVGTWFRDGNVGMIVSGELSEVVVERFTVE